MSGNPVSFEVAVVGQAAKRIIRVGVGLKA